MARRIWLIFNAKALGFLDKNQKLEFNGMNRHHAQNLEKCSRLLNADL
jgi:hypothetical protein